MSAIESIASADGVMIRPQKMKRDIGLVADHPTVVRTDVLRPFPARLVTRPADCHRADLYDFELSLRENPDLIRLLEAFDQQIDVARRHCSGRGRWRNRFILRWRRR